MKKLLKTSVTTKGQTTIPKPVRDALGVEPHDAVYWQIAGREARVTAEEPDLFQWFGSIRVGRGSTVRDVASARKQRGRPRR
jgi:bifunctional DNA-binding transcriptional regulator/antitoxin component of YhaV-PrlF toxin-antitoxin module